MVVEVRDESVLAEVLGAPGEVIRPAAESKSDAGKAALDLTALDDQGHQGAEQDEEVPDGQERFGALPRPRQQLGEDVGKCENDGQTSHHGDQGKSKLTISCVVGILVLRRSDGRGTVAAVAIEIEGTGLVNGRVSRVHGLRLRRFSMYKTESKLTFNTSDERYK